MIWLFACKVRVLATGGGNQERTDWLNLLITTKQRYVEVVLVSAGVVVLDSFMVATRNDMDKQRISYLQVGCCVDVRSVVEEGRLL